MKISTEELRQNLIERTRKIINRVEQLRNLPVEVLNKKVNTESWSILECLEHLNLYGDYYNPEIKRVLMNNRTQPEQQFKGSILGNYFEKSMLPKEKLNTMKTFKDKDPIGSNLGIETIDRFLKQQHELLNLIEDSKKVSLIKTKNNISISKFLKLRVGDTFRFIVAHNERHILQAEKTIK